VHLVKRDVSGTFGRKEQDIEKKWYFDREKEE